LFRRARITNLLVIFPTMLTTRHVVQYILRVEEHDILNPALQ
jgi:hypothetical protein